MNIIFSVILLSRTINPIFGTMEDFDTMMAEAKR